MSSDPKRVKEIFLGAADQPDEAARAAYLDRACGKDAGLRDRVEALLDSHDPAGSFLASPAVKAAELDHGATQELGSAATPEGKDEAADDMQFLSPSARPDALGRLRHYEMLQVLGRGGFGIVFRAFDDMLQRVVAVKVMAPQIATLSPARKRFLREARSSAAVRHENVVHVYEVGEQPLPFLVMEFIPGETLQQKLNRCGPLEVPEVLRIGRQIAEGLAAAHASDLIHRDIKPGNILLEGGTLKVKITDFGLARAADDASISQSGIVAGTPMFMSPEQALGHQIDQRADLFSLGSVLYQMASGRPPFRAPSALAVLKRVAEESPRPIPEIIPETPDWLCGIIAKLHAKTPDDRFQSAREVADLLADCEAKLKAKQEVKNLLTVAVQPAAKRDVVREARDQKRGTRGEKRWVVAAAVLLLSVIALAVTEFTGVTHLFRQQATLDLIKAVGDATPVVVAKKEAPGLVAKQETPVEKKETPPPAPAAWTVLKPIETKSEGGATLTLQDDRAVLVSGNHPDSDVYTLTFRELPTKIQALRLEVLTHDSLPDKGPGRHPTLTFVLSTIKAELDPAKGGPPLTLNLTKAWGDFGEDDSLPSHAIDADDNTGWSAEIGQSHYAVFELEKPVAVTAGAVLRVTLEFKHENPQRQLGCFRLSAAPDANAAKVDAQGQAARKAAPE